MLFVELLVPKEAFTEAECRALASSLTAERLLLGGEGVPRTDPGVLAWFGSLTHVIVRQPDIWITGGDAPGDKAPACCVVRIHVGAWAKEMSEHLIARATQELVDTASTFDGRPREPQVLVHVFGVPEGGYGLDGRVRRTADFQEMMEQAKTGTAEAPPGMAIDPACGAVVPADSPITVELDGEVFRFCCTHCRGSFVKQRRAAAPS
ncbi:hypothetical protein [Actinomadura monticuli]|uniref:TRASH domain-containing protein n=1 Tax=Actinomadura monticuli TaxID=3097367 RepID=A0ABV4Q702_9ACTN